MRLAAIVAAIFLGAVGVLYVLDRQGMLPAAYTGTAETSTTSTTAAKPRPKPGPPRWYQLAEPVKLTLTDDTPMRVAVALQLPKQLPEFVTSGALKGQLVEEPIVRDVVLETLSVESAGRLRSLDGRRELAGTIRRRINARSDLQVRRVVLPTVIVGV